MNNKSEVSHPEYRVRALRPSEVDDRLLAAWADLEARALVPNAFLSPYFVMPAIRYLETGSDVFGVFVEKTSGGVASLVGVGIFQVRKPTRQFPLVHLAAFESIHSYLSGFLLDEEYADEALRMLYGYLTEGRHAWHGLYINNCPPEHLLTEEMSGVAAEFGMKWSTFSQWQRATFSTADFGRLDAMAISKHAFRDYHRHLRNLKGLGGLEWRLVRGAEPHERNVDEFLRLENMGWKGRDGTSLYSDANHVGFFKEMINGFYVDNRAYFTELVVNGRTISSTSELISGRAGFGFKLGWDPDYAKYSPGIVNLIQMMERGKDFLGDLDYIDSSTAPDSYVNKIWIGRRDMFEGIFALTPVGRAALVGVQIAKKIRKTLLSHRFNSSHQK